MAYKGRMVSKPPAEAYEVLDKIGQGSYGYVCRAKRVEDGKIVAIKIIELEGAQDEIEDIEAEVKIMSRVSSQYIVEFYASYIVNTDLWIVMEYCEGGACADIIYNGGLQEQYVSIIAREMLKGLDYLHSNGNLHRDVKAANVLICKDGSVKLADFSVSGQLTSAATRKNTFVGTPYWMAPEVINQSGYNASADIWSFGITIIELSEGRPPYSEMHPMKALFSIPSSPAPRLSSSFTKPLRELVEMCLNKNPRERPTARELLKHKLIKSARRNSLLLEIIPKVKSPGHEPKAKKSAAGGPKKNDEHPSGGECDAFWNFDTVKGSTTANDITVRVQDNSLLRGATTVSPPRDGDCIPKVYQWFDGSSSFATTEKLGTSVYFDKTVVFMRENSPPEANKPDTRIPSVATCAVPDAGMVSRLEKNERTDAASSSNDGKFESCTSNDTIYQNVVFNSLISSIDKVFYGYKNSECSKSADKLKAAFIECEKTLSGFGRILIEEVISSIESKYR